MKLILVGLYNILFLTLKQIYVSVYHITKSKIKTSNIESVMLYCSDADRGFIYQDKKYAQILDSYVHLYFKDQRIACSIGPPGSGVESKNFYTNFCGPSFIDSVYFLVATLIDIFTIGKTRQRDQTLSSQYRKLIKNNNCKKLVGIQPPDVLIDTCRLEKVSVYDIQHGDIAPGVPYYENVARRYKNLNFLVWDNVTSMMMQNYFGVDESRITICGHPWINNVNYSVRSKNNFFLLQLQKARNLYLGDFSRKVLVTLQYGLDKMYPQYFDNEFLPRALIETIKSTRNISWCLRLHPLMSNDKLHSKFLNDLTSANDNITLHHSHEIALPVIMHSTDMHITWHSSSVIEAINFGIPSMVLCNQPYNYGVEKLYLNDARIKPYEQYFSTGLVSWPREEYGSMLSDIISFIKLHKGKK
jgi:hypothetical protein